MKVEEAVKVKEKALDLGLDAQVEKFELTMNRAAEEASKEAGPIFVNAITGMTIGYGFAILKGEDNAATEYLKSKTSRHCSLWYSLCNFFAICYSSKLLSFHYYINKCTSIMI